MANKTIDALVFCPFYVTESCLSITCEGIISLRMVSQFESETAKMEHEQDFCCGKTCRGCPLFRELARKYDALERH